MGVRKGIKDSEAVLKFHNEWSRSACDVGRVGRRTIGYCDHAPFIDRPSLGLGLATFGEQAAGMEARIVLLRTHQKNMDRYEGLLETKLSEG